MSEPYIGQVLCAGFTFAPTGYALCDGTSIKILQNQALYSLLGNAFGGDTTSFKLPDLRGRSFFGAGQSPISGAVYARGQFGGFEEVTLTDAQVPGHQHNVIASSNAGTLGIQGNIYSSVGPSQGRPTYPLYAAPQTVVPLNNPVSTAGGSQAHSNMQPFLVVNFAIATNGYYPQRS